MNPVESSAGNHLDAPFVYCKGGYKSLHFTPGQLQSRMCSAEPTRLEVDYTRTMMGFLMFTSCRTHIAMVGLGGGSLLKFCHRHLPEARFTVIEINPGVIALREEFEVPPDSERVAVICADAADYLRQTRHRFDVLLIDGFDSQGQAESLCSQAFYDDCFRALSHGGVMAVNLHNDHPEHPVFTGRIRLAFDGNLTEIPCPPKKNSIVFARKGSCPPGDELRLNSPLPGFDLEVRAQLQGEFARISREMTSLV